MPKAIVSLSRSFLLRVLALLAIMVLIPSAIWAIEPPRRGELDRYRRDGSLARRLAYARRFGNHRFHPALVQRKLRQMAPGARQPTAIFPWGTALPSEGSPKILALLIEFPDYAHVNAPSLFDSKLWGDGDASEEPMESLRDFYARSSYGRLNLTGVTLGWYTAQKDRDQYDDPAVLIEEAITAFDQQGIDFSQFDNNGDGQIDYFMVFWTGPDTGWGSLWWGWFTPSFWDPNFRVDGKTLGGFSWQWESNPVGEPFHASTVIHETGHALGLPDYYDYDPSQGPDGGLGLLDQMDGNIGDHNCFSKWMLGWISPVVVGSVAEANSLLLRPSGTSPDAAVVMPGASRGQPFAEYFMVQARTRVGNDNDPMWPADGLLIWHVDARLNSKGDDFQYDNSYTEHKLLRLMEADGLEEIESLTDWADAGDFYTPGKEFGPDSTPNSNDYLGQKTEVMVHSITSEGSGYRAWVSIGEIADLLIKQAEEDASAYGGNNIRQVVPSGNQIETQGIGRGATAAFHVQIENDAAGSASFCVKAVENSEPGWSVAYKKQDGTDITSLIRGNGYITGDLPGHSAETLIIEMTPGTDAVGDRAKSSTLSVYRSAGATRVIDAVQAVAVFTSMRQPDLLIKLESEGDDAFALDDTYQETPSGGQVKSHSVLPLVAATYQVRVENDGNLPQSFALRTTESTEAGWSVTYRVGGTDITDAVRSSTGYRTPVLAPGETITVTISVTPSKAATGGTSKVVTLSAFLGASDATARDAVQAVTTVGVVDQGDLLIKAAGEQDSAYAVDNVYQTAPSGAQARRAMIYAGDSAAYQVKVQNDGNVPNRTLVVKAEESATPGWSVAYKSGATDITAQVRSAVGYTTAPLDRGASEVITVEMTPGASVPAGSTKSVLLRVFRTADQTEAFDAVQAAATMRHPSQPDLLILSQGETDEAWALDDTYQTSPEGDQVERPRTDPRVTTTCRVKVQNDGKTPRTFVIRAAESTEAGWTVDYKVGGVSVREAITSPAGYVTREIPVGSSDVISVELTPDRSVRGGTSKTTTLTAHLDSSDATVRDAVQVVATANVVRSIDLLVRAESQPAEAFTGDDTYQGEPSSPQVIEHSVGWEEPAVYRIRLQNDGNARQEAPTIKATESTEAGWTVTYQVNGADVSAQVRSDQGCTLDSIAPGQSTDVVVTVTPGRNLERGTTKSVTVRAAVAGLEGTARDAVRVVTRAANRPPSSVEILSPAAGAQVPLTPAFEVKAVDPDGDRLYFLIELQRGSVRLMRQTDEVDSGVTARWTVPSDQPLTAGEWTCRVKAVDSGGGETAWSDPRTFVANRVPGVPEVLAPDDNSVVSARPQFRLKATDPDADAVGFVIQVEREGTTLEYSVEPAASGVETAFVPPAGQPLSAGVWTWRVQAVDANGGRSDWSAPRTLQVPASGPSVSQTAGLSTLGLPFLGDSAPQALGLSGARVAVWDAVSQRYLKDADVTQIRTGQGAWVKTSAPVPLQFAGRAPSGPAAVPLKRGWNLISSPFLVPITWDLRTLSVRRGGEVRSLAAAVSAGWLSDYALGWQANPSDPNTGRYVLIYDAWMLPGVQNKLEPWQAYWVKAAVECELILEPSAGTGRAARTQRTAGDGWSVRLQALSRTGAAEVLVGAMPAGRGLNIGVPPAPPSDAAGLVMSVASREGPASVDVRQDATSRLEWDLVVNLQESGGRAATPTEVTLSWPDLRALPKDLSLTLVDTATGERRYLRTTASYTFRAGEGSRRFRLIAEPRSGAALAITGLALDTLRSDARLVRFTLSRPAAVDLEILSPAGQSIATVARGRAADAGQNQVVWSGQLARGIYLLRATATTEEGARVQVLMPVAVVR